MKNLIIITVFALIITGLLSFKSIVNDPAVSKLPSPQEVSGFTVPDNIRPILDKSCLPCHGADGKGKAKMKWNYEKMKEMKTSKLVSKLSKIASKVKKGKMPTKKFIKKYPDRNLTDEEKNTLINWAENYADQLVGE